MIDLLRCVNEHEDTWLVASFRQITNRMVIEGTLGCPICSAEYEIVNGVPDFARGERQNPATPTAPEDRQLGALAGAAGSAAPIPSHRAAARPRATPPRPAI